MRGALAVAVLAFLAACDKTPSQPTTSPDGWYSLEAQGVYVTDSQQLTWSQLPTYDDPRQGCNWSIRGGGTLHLANGKYWLDMAYTTTCVYSPQNPYHEEGSYAQVDGALTFSTGDASKPTRIVGARRGNTGDAWRPAETIDLQLTNPTAARIDNYRFNQVQAPAQ